MTLEEKIKNIWNFGESPKCTSPLLGSGGEQGLSRRKNKKYLGIWGNPRKTGLLLGVILSDKIGRGKKTGLL